MLLKCTAPQLKRKLVNMYPDMTVNINGFLRKPIRYLIQNLYEIIQPIVEPNVCE